MTRHALMGAKAAREYRAWVLSTNPVSYWRLGEASGIVARDEMGANNGTYVGSPTLGVAGLLTGDSDTAVEFNGTTQSISTGTPEMVGACSFGFWITPAAITGLNNGRLLAGQQDDGAISLIIAGGALNFNWHGPSGWTVYAGGSLTIGALHFVVATRSSGGVGQFYIDGSPVTTTLAAGVAQGQDANGYTYLLADGPHSTYDRFSGTIDEPAAWSRALSASEIDTGWRIGTGR